MDPFSIIMTTAVIALIILVKVMYYKISSVTVAKEKVDEISISLAESLREKNKRVEELNEALEHGYGIKAETKVVEVKFDLDDGEKEVLLNGLMLMISNEGTVDGSRYLLDVYDKVVGIMYHEQ